MKHIETPKYTKTSISEVYYSADLLGAAKERFDLAYDNLNGAFVDEDSAFYRV